MVLLDDFGDIVLKTADLCSAKDDCVRLKNALVNLGNSKDWDALVKRANAGKLDGVNVLLRPVSAESLDNWWQPPPRRLSRMKRRERHNH